MVDGVFMGLEVMLFGWGYVVVLVVELLLLIVLLYFLCDVYLGVMVWLLCMVGFDIVYDNNYVDVVIEVLVLGEDWIVFLCDCELFKWCGICWGVFICVCEL